MSTNYSPFLLGARYLNDVNMTTLGAGGTDTRNQYLGMLGQKVSLGIDEAVQLTNFNTTNYSSTTPLQPGTYQLVKLKSSLTITPQRGLVVWWDAAADPNSFIVTTDAPIATGGRFAGILLNAGTAGNYVYIAVDGAPFAKAKAALTAAAAKDQIMVVDNATATVDNLAAATAITSDNINRIVGQAADLPVANTLKRVSIGTKSIAASGLQ